MRLACALIRSALTGPILQGRVAAGDLELGIRTANVDANTRGMLAGDYDLSEMSIATYVQARTRGADLAALPIFLGRRFMQPGIYYHPRVPIASPADIRGRRAVVPQYWLTSSLWHRALLEHEYGVPPASVAWITTVEERIDAEWPRGVDVVHATERTDLSNAERAVYLAEAGKADVVLYPVTLKSPEHLVPLFSDALTVSLDYRRRTGIYPLVHVLVARGSLVREQPKLGRQLLELFTRAKEHAYAHDRGAVESPFAGLTFDEAWEALGGDPYPFGVEENAASIEAFLQYAHEQGLATRRLGIDEAFPRELR